MFYCYRKAFCHDPDLVIAHRQKDLEVWLTRTSAVILCRDEIAGEFQMHIARSFKLFTA